MADSKDPKQDEVIERYIDKNLKKVFSQYADEEMPSEITDLLSVLRAQDKEASKE